MSRKITKLLAVILSILLIGTYLIACGQKKGMDEQESKSSTVTEATQQQKEELKEVTLRFYFVGEKKTATDEVWTKVAEITKDRLNAKFQINFIPWNDYADKMQLLSASGDDYDMNYDADWFIYPKMVNKGAYLALNDLIVKYAPKLYAKYQEMNVLKACSVDGKIMALPWTIKKCSKPWFMYRSDLTKKYNIQVGDLKTIEDVDKLLYDFKKAGVPVSPILWDKSTSPDGAVTWMLYPKYEMDRWDFHHFTIDLNDSKCKVIPIEQTEMWKEACKYANKWYKDGIIPKNMLTQQVADPFTNCKCASAVGFADAALMATGFVDKKAEKAYSELYPNKKYRLDSPLNNVMCINKNAANPERTLMFLELLSTDRSVYDTVLYGIEGKTYVLDGNKVKYPEGMDSATSNYQEWHSQWGFWRMEFMRPDTSRDEEFWVKNKEFLDKTTNVVSPLAGFIPDTEPIKTELARRDVLYDELGVLLAFGMVDDVDKALNEYIEKQKAAGLDKIVAELQKQVDAWIASK